MGKKKNLIFNCKNCEGKVIYRKTIGWGHIEATGCVKPAVRKEDWHLYLKERKGGVLQSRIKMVGKITKKQPEKCNYETFRDELYVILNNLLARSCRERYKSQWKEAQIETVIKIEKMISQVRQEAISETLDKVKGKLEYKLTKLFVKAIDYGASQAHGKKGWYEIKYERIDKYINRAVSDLTNLKNKLKEGKDG